MTDAASGIRSIVVERLLPHSPEKVWRTLTDSSLIARWLMPNDFVPRLGHRFTFKTLPMGDWDGVVHCEVLACEPPHLLRYSWTGGSDTNPAYGSRLDSVVTFTLSPRPEGTFLRMEHAGFRLPGNAMAYDMMTPGWGKLIDRIDQLTGVPAA